MSKKLIFIFIIILVFVGVYLWKVFFVNIVPTNEPIEFIEEAEVLEVNEPDQSPHDIKVDKNNESPEIPDVTTIAKNLTIPWDIAFLPSGELLVTERAGRLVKINNNGELIEIPIQGVKHKGEGGLLGIALHPNYSENNFVYLYITKEINGKTINSVTRYRLLENDLIEEKSIIDNIPGALYHNGGRIKFGPDGYLYITTGDASNDILAQNTSSLAGKILRLTENGTPVNGNPFNNAVYSYGHRNPQGLAWDDDGKLWSTEHGRSGKTSGLDEINLISMGGNYGWPDSQGDEVVSNTIGPKLHSGADITWAPASALHINGSIFFGGLKGETLYEAVIKNGEVRELKEHYKGVFGRIRSVVFGPDNMIYITTSNRDNRGKVRDGDDKIIRLNPSQFLE